MGPSGSAADAELSCNDGAPRFAGYLRAASQSINTASALHVVIGNEACDADSIISTLVWAYYESHAAAADTLFVPVVSCRRADWPLRREASLLISGAIEASSLLGALTFLDDVVLSEALARARSVGTLKVTLMDHNRLDSGGAALGLRDADVTAIIDHHADSGAHAHVTGDARVISFVPSENRGVGSTCTLVAARMLTGGSDAACPLTAPIARALLGVILLDTAGLVEAAGKTTAEDLRVAGALASRCDTSPAALFASLSALRNDPAFWLGLSVEQALAYDYKSFASAFAPAVAFGTSAICVNAGAFLGATPHGGLTRDVIDAAAAYGAAQHVAFLVLLSAAPSNSASAAGGIERQLAFFEPPRDREHAAVARHALGRLRACDKIQLREIARAATADGGMVFLFEQGVKTASRKQIAPLLIEWLSEDSSRA